MTNLVLMKNTCANILDMIKGLIDMRARKEIDQETFIERNNEFKKGLDAIECEWVRAKNVHPGQYELYILYKLPEEKTKGGIIIPDTAKEKPQRGEVVAVGPGKDGNLMTVQVGDIVLYGKYSGQELNYEGTDFLIMREDDILVILS